MNKQSQVVGNTHYIYLLNFFSLLPKNLEKKNFKCEICHITLTRKNFLTNHIKIIHKEAEEYSCIICGKTSKKRENMKIHIKRVHEEDNHIKCDDCGKLFGFKSERKKHIELFKKTKQS